MHAVLIIDSMGLRSQPDKRSCCTKLRTFLIGIGVMASIGPFFVSLFVFWDIDRSSWFPDTLIPQSNDHGESMVVHRSSSEQSEYHIVFSTSCTAQQHWESYIFFYHAKRVGQRGTVTRIASGCSKDETVTLQAFHEKYISALSPSFKLHMTPDFGRLYLTEGKYPYKYMNKPFGLRHWMEHVLLLGWNLDNTTIVTKEDVDSNVLDGIIILMDPDMILLRPISHDFSDEYYSWAEQPETTVVSHGHPIAQQDAYLNSEWTMLNFSHITGDMRLQVPAQAEGPKRWNSGPPYVATVSDMYKISSLWTVTAPRVLEVYPKLFAEMYGFIIATVMLDMPFSLTKSIVVSTTVADEREGWIAIDKIQDTNVCKAAIDATTETSLANISTLPNALHYCKRYVLGTWFFSKYRIKKNIMKCNKNLLRLPPFDFFPALNHTIFPPRADLKDAKTYQQVQKIIRPKQAKREAFMLCGMMTALNEALKFYKQDACGKDGAAPANLNEEYTIFDDPTDF